MSKNDGGQAFPVPYVKGMSLRDYFAGQAIASLAKSGVIADYPSLHIAEICYRLADAMLEAREKG